MLRTIKLNNFTTFLGPVEVSFAATNYKFLEKENVGSNKILKGGLFVGENASGKTMILESVKLLLDLLFNDNTDSYFFRYKSFYTNENCKLEYEFVIDSKFIIYSFEFDSKKIVSEKLIYDNKEIINRLNTSATLKLGDEKHFDDISDKLLFLRRVYFDTSFYNDKVLNRWFSYLKNSIFINCFNKEAYSYNGKNLSIHKLENKIFEKEINNFMRKIGYKQKIQIVSGLNENENTVLFVKDGTKTAIPDVIESTGNQVLVEILPSFFHLIENEGMLIFDEFSSGLHNELEECIIKYFFHYSKNSQLLFTSHSTNILNNTILRPDQVYSVNFDSKKGSHLKRFSDEMPRESQNLEKMYLNGVFNGVPRYNKIFKD